MAEPAFGKWEPIASAPKDGTAILLLDREVMSVCRYRSGKQSNNPVVRALAGKDGYWQQAGSAMGFFNPTHWTPLPPPPASQGEGGEG